VEDLISGGASAEEIQYLFLYGELPREGELRDFVSKVERGYRVPAHVTSAISNLPRSSDAVALQMGASRRWPPPSASSGTRRPTGT
jgi:citrate synthase (EC 2.3.3.1)